jgi:hypothetical protein
MNFATGLHGVWLNFIKVTEHGANAFGAELLHVGANVYGAELCWLCRTTQSGVEVLRFGAISIGAEHMDFLGLNVQYRAARLATSAPKYEGTNIVKFGATLAGAERRPTVRRHCQRRRSPSLRSVLSLAPKWHNFEIVQALFRRQENRAPKFFISAPSCMAPKYSTDVGALPYGAELANVGVVVWRRKLEREIVSMDKCVSAPWKVAPT